MTFNSINEGRYWRNFFIRTLLVVVTVAIIVWCLPREKNSTFHYDIGKPWMYGSFIAQFDFPVYKTDETIKHEQDSMLSSFQPYFRFNSSVEGAMITQFRKDFKNGIPGLSGNFVDIIANRLHRLYSMGIMPAAQYGPISGDSTFTVRVISGRNAQSVQIGCIFSTVSAYQQLLNDEQLSHYKPILQHCNLNNYINANLIYDVQRNETEKSDILSSIPMASGMVIKGQKVIDRGEIVGDYAYRVLSSYEREMKRRDLSDSDLSNLLIGQSIFVSIIIIIFTLYLWLFRRDYFDKWRSVLMLYLPIIIFPILVSLMMKNSFSSIYIVPFAMTPVFIRVFMDSRTAFITHVCTVLICAVAVRYQYEFILVQLVSGLVAIYSLRELYHRAQVFRTAIFVTIASSAVYFAIQMMQSSSVFIRDFRMYYYFIANGMLLLACYPLMYLIERLFGFTSDVTLFELSNTNRGVMRDLSEIAPGTFQHSTTVANMAAAIANRIGANSLLVRTGGLYHDIGKMENPVFFTENQVGLNPLENMPCKEAARIIINHVSDGIKISEKYNLPQFIKDFILTHHGLGMAKYFYIKYQNEHPDEIIDKALFTYPGPNPFTREQAILMMADTSEAASRSLKEYTSESITELVNRVIDKQVSDGFYTECPITFRDISLAKMVIIERLKAIYHTRISYPELNKEAEKTVESEKEAEDAEKKIKI